MSEGRALSWRRDEAGRLELVLHRPPLNELGEASLGELEAFLPALREPATRGVLVRSGLPRGFCAGADLRALLRGLEEGGPGALEQVGAFLRRIGEVLCALDEAPVPVVAAVHGPCFGGGLELVLCCDLVVADRTARFGFPELRLGLVPGFGGTVRAARDLSRSRLRDLLLTGRSLSAEAAREAGLVAQVVAEGQAEPVARRALEQATRQDPAALAAAKRLLKPRDPAALGAEREVFLGLLARPQVLDALRGFAARQDPLPWLPDAPPPRAPQEVP